MSRMQWLVALLAVWIAAAVYAWSMWPAERHVPLKYVKGQPPASNAEARAQKAKNGGSDLPAGRQVPPRPKPSLANPPAASTGPTSASGPLVIKPASRAQPPAAIAKDLFVMVDSFRPKPPPPPSAPPPPPPPPPPTEKELAEARARQELAQFRYLGYQKRGGRDQAFLERSGESLVANQGETVQGHFYIKEVTPTKVTIVESSSQIETSISPDH